MSLTQIFRFLIPIIVPFSVFSQHFTGLVVDAVNGDTLTGAIIKSGDSKLTISDDHGFFKWPYSTTQQTLEIRYSGYQTLKIHVSPEKDSTLLICNLKPDVLLDEVVVSAGRFEQKQSELTVSIDLLKPELIHQKNTTQLDQIVTQVPV